MVNITHRSALRACTALSILLAVTTQAGAQQRQITLDSREIGSEPNPVNEEQPVRVPQPGDRTVLTVPAKPSAWSWPMSYPIGDDGKLTFGGFLRFRTNVRFDDIDRKTKLPATTNYFGFDTLTLRLAYESSTIFGGLEYRILGGANPYDHFNGYKQYVGELNFLRYAFVGYKLNPYDSISVGLQQVPFGLLPYYGTSSIETLGYTMGIEDVFNVGVKFSHVEPDFNYQLAYFPADGGNYFGISQDSARYSVNFVRRDSYVTGGTNTAEQNMLVGRAEYSLLKQEGLSATLGASVWHSSIYNYDAGRFGSRQQEAVHFTGVYGGWSLLLLGARLDINPGNRNQGNDLITIGAYDSSNNLATRGWFVSADLSYAYKPAEGLFSSITPYVDYSAYYKDRADFRDSERVIGGAAFLFRDIPGLGFRGEYRRGRNDPYTGARQFVQGLGAGGDNRWKSGFALTAFYNF